MWRNRRQIEQLIFVKSTSTIYILTTNHFAFPFVVVDYFYSLLLISWSTTADWYSQHHQQLTAPLNDHILTLIHLRHLTHFTLGVY